MHDRQKGLLGTVLASRAILIETLLIALFLSIGVEFLTAGLLELSDFSPGWNALIGALVVLLTIAYLVNRLLGSRETSRHFDGFLIYRSSDDELLKVPRYHFATHVADFLHAAFAENATFKRDWDDDGQDPPDGDAKDFRPLVSTACSRRSALIREAVEYYVLRTLSVHLIDYFNLHARSEEEVVRFSREHIPDVLFKNRFLRLFSSPIEERPAFLDLTANMPADLATVYAVSAGPNGAMYERFELTLPKNSLVRRTSPQTIEIETKRLRMTLTVEFAGFGTYVPFEFIEYVLSEDPQTVRASKVGVEVTVRFSTLHMLTRSGWQYWNWVDSFLESLDQRISRERYFSSIQWESARTIISTLSKGK